HLDPHTGAYKVNVLQPMQGGSGGRPTKDGIDGVNFSAGSLRNVPTEAIELEAPVFVHRYMLSENTAAGGHRGGAAVTFEFQVSAPNTIVTARGMDRFRIRPWGRKGGQPGTLGETLLNPGTDRERNVGKIDVLKLQPGDTVRITSPGGGGYGDPLDRDPERVQRDVADGLVTVERAASDYGVMLDDGKVDAAATVARRVALRAQRTGPLAEFVFGPERAAYEARVPKDLQDVVAAVLQEYPGAVRLFLKEQLYRRFEADGVSGLDQVTLHERVRAHLKAMEV